MGRTRRGSSSSSSSSKETEGGVEVKCLDDGRVYHVDAASHPTGVVVTRAGVSNDDDDDNKSAGDAPSLPAPPPSSSSGADATCDEEKDEEEAELAARRKRSFKARRGQRLQESVGLKAKTKDVQFVAAKHRVAVHAVRVAELLALLKTRDLAVRKVAEVDAELAVRLRELAGGQSDAKSSPRKSSVSGKRPTSSGAASTPLSPAADAFASELERRKRVLETDVLPSRVGRCVRLCERWKATLVRFEADAARDQEAARVQSDPEHRAVTQLDIHMREEHSGCYSISKQRRLDHYALKAEKLRRLKEKRDVQRLEKEAEIAAKKAQGEPVKSTAKAPAVDEKKDKRYFRNKAKHDAARRDFAATTAAGCRAFDAAVADRWHDLAPVLEELLAWDRETSKLRVDESDLVSAAETSLKGVLTDVVPLESRLVAARAGHAYIYAAPHARRATEEEEDGLEGSPPPARAAPALPTTTLAEDERGGGDHAAIVPSAPPAYDVVLPDRGSPTTPLEDDTDSDDDDDDDESEYSTSVARDQLAVADLD